MEKGYLKVETFIGERLAPVIGTKVVVECQKGNILHEVFTNENGHSEMIPLNAYPKKASDDPWHVPSQRYTVTVTHKRGFRKIIVHGVEIFLGIDSILPIRMLPDPMGDSEPHEIFIPTRRDESPCGCPNESKLISVLAINAHSRDNKELIVPSHVRVHTSEENIKIPLKDYIKNVASTENVHSLESAALGANILLLASRVIEKVSGHHDSDRVLAESNFPFAWGRSIPGNVSKMVDEIWGYCFVTSDESGTAPICNNAWQVSANALAIRGYNPVQIVNYLCPKLVIWKFLEESGEEE